MTKSIKNTVDIRSYEYNGVPVITRSGLATFIGLSRSSFLGKAGVKKLKKLQLNKDYYVLPKNEGGTIIAGYCGHNSILLTSSGVLKLADILLPKYKQSVLRAHELVFGKCVKTSKVVQFTHEKVIPTPKQPDPAFIAILSAVLKHTEAMIKEIKDIIAQQEVAEKVA